MATQAIKSLEKIKAQPTLGTTDSSTEDILFPAVKSAYYLYVTRTPDASLCDPEALKQIFRLLNKSITIPGLTLGTAESVNGFAGTSKAYSFTTVEDSKEISIGFNDNVDQVVYNVMKQWVYGIKDPHTGLSKVQDYNLRNLSCDFMLITTKPVHATTEEGIANAIDHVYWFKHVAPTNLPTDAVGSHSKDASDKIELEFTFKFREMVDNESTLEFGKNILPELLAQVSTHDSLQVNQ